MLEHMIRFTHRNIGTNRDYYIYSSLNVKISQDKQQFLLNPHVEDLNAKDLSLTAVGKGNKKKIHKEEAGQIGVNQGLEWTC